MEVINRLEEKWFSSSSVKNIWDGIYRKRVMRWRILFTESKKEKNVFDIWIIDIEKDTDKDYERWKKYIIQEIKNRNKK